MPLFRSFLIATCLTILPAVHALAQDQGSAEPAERVEIVTDQEEGAVRILIDGQPVVLIDETGLHVRENISHGGTHTDYGRSGFDSHAAEAGRDEE